MKILYLCARKYWLHKMSRVRFHAIEAIGRHIDVELTRDGPGFPKFSNVENSINTYKPDAVIWYNPTEMKGYEHARSMGLPLMICYNEMHDGMRVIPEIQKSGANIVVCHLGNYIEKYRNMFQDVDFRVVPHCAEKEIFRPTQDEKSYDILLVGTVDRKIYPLRNRLRNIMIGMMSLSQATGYKCKILKHPGYRIKGVNRQVVEYAQEINRAKIVVSCSSVYNYALAKYIEVGACGTCLVADIPFDRPDWYRQWVYEVHPKENASSISSKLAKLVDSGEWRQWGAKAREACKSETQEKYADQIVSILKEHIHNAAM
jgi:hypothetical protein